jgi:hypothetical protein
MSDQAAAVIANAIHYLGDSLFFGLQATSFTMGVVKIITTGSIINTRRKK